MNNDLTGGMTNALASAGRQLTGSPSYPTSTNEIAAALAKAQCEMSNPSFDAQNPHFKNRYASLAAVRNAVIPVLSKHGVALLQSIETGEGTVRCTTHLYHSSGQSLVLGPLILPVSKQDAQGYGSAITYARRYALMAVCGVVGDDDDDAEQAVGRNGKVDPRGDLGKDIPALQAEATANTMFEALEEDIEDDLKAPKVYEIHRFLNSQPSLYVAAADVLKKKRPNLDKYWKALIYRAGELRR
jgi:ERF superfamily